MGVSTNRLEDERDDRAGMGEPTRRRIDVTDMDADSLTRYVSEQIETDQVSLENRGRRTYLLVEN